MGYTVTDPEEGPGGTWTPAPQAEADPGVSDKLQQSWTFCLTKLQCFQNRKLQTLKSSKVRQNSPFCAKRHSFIWSPASAPICMTVNTWVARDLWQCKQISSLDFALGLGSFTAINSWLRALTIRKNCRNCNVLYLHKLYLIIYQKYHIVTRVLNKIHTLPSLIPRPIPSFSILHPEKQEDLVCKVRCSVSW